ncbi:MAG TPA: glycine C-acetyltransferase, partial [Acidobacteriota bacterium]|nr:glycine C-acetyltransferase [Acidobacteriota bacterium]
MSIQLDDFLARELTELHEKGLYRQLRILEGQQLAQARFDGRMVVNLSSNNYLGLNTHPILIRAAVEATERFGVGSGAVRTIAGTMKLHLELEEKIARFKDVEACVVFQSGFTANAGTVSAILGKGDIIISDELNHASIIDGCRLSRAEIRVFPHKDTAALERILEEAQSLPGKKLVISDGVFSMEGDIAPLPQIVEFAERYGAIMMVDDAHASGVLGKSGRGSIDHFGLHGRVDIQVGTLSKAIGALGGYVCGSRKLIEYLYHRARPFLFSTSHPPAVAATCIAAFEILEKEPQWIARLWNNTRFFKAGLEKLGFNTGFSETPITPVIVGKGELAMRFSDDLFKEGVFAQGVGYPTVPEPKSRIRTIVTATHSREQL